MLLQWAAPYSLLPASGLRSETRRNGDWILVPMRHTKGANKRGCLVPNKHLAAAVVFLVALLAAAGANATTVPPPGAPLPPEDLEANRTHTSVVVTWDVPVNLGDPITAYEVAYKQLGAALWRTDADDSTGVVAENTREVQVVATRADFGQTIGFGYFRLSLNYETLTDIDPETRTQTDLIPYNATAEFVKAQLESLENINVIEVRRTGPLAQNTYEWKVTLDWLRRRGDIPLIDVSQEQLFDVTWDGGRGVVWVREERKGTIGDTMCSVHCHHLVDNLQPGTQYQFRVRAISAAGPSEWSGASSIIRTVQLAPPAAPASPKLVSAGTSSITVAVVIPDRRDSGDRAYLTMETQYQIVPDPSRGSLSSGNLAGGSSATFEGGGGAWKSLPIGRVGAVDSIDVVASGLPANTGFQFRTRAVVPIGPSPWSPVSATLFTKPGPPIPPELQTISVADVGFSSVPLSWKRPSGENGSPVESYDVQYREEGGQWVQAASGIPALLREATREVQTVSTRTDAGFPISHGTFTLSLNIEGLSDFDSETPTRTVPIPWDATAATVAEALEALAPVGPVEVRRSGPSELNEYTWQVTLDWGKSPTEIRGDLPNLDADAAQLGGRWTGGGGRGVVVRELRKGQKAVLRGEVAAAGRAEAADDNQLEASGPLPSFTVNGLKALTLYQFRVRANNALGHGDWTAPSERVRTSAVPFGDPEGSSIPFGVPHPYGNIQKLLLDDISLPLPPLPAGSRMLPAQAIRYPAEVSMLDPDYVAGIGVGGEEGQTGGHGLIVFRVFTGYQRTSIATSVFHYRDVNVYGTAPQLYTVPNPETPGVVINHVTVKVWGAGGGGGSTVFGHGGGGGFVQTQLAARTGDVFAVFVGGGGEGYTGHSPGRGGFNGGGAGGFGEYGSGGGGGSSSVHGLLPHDTFRERDEKKAQLESGDKSTLMAIPLVVAGGGGGAGASHYCCSHGGGGGGLSAIDPSADRGLGAPGFSPVTTPRDVSGDASRNHDVFADERDESGFPPYHRHLDSGFAPEADLSVIAQPGGGAGILGGGKQGVSGSFQWAELDLRSGWAAPLNGIDSSPLPGRSSVPTDGTGVVPTLDRTQRRNDFVGATATNPTPGGWGVGGSGGGGKEAGGGGGGGLFGGGGGGAGVDGAGGGGGSSYVHFPAIFKPNQAPLIPEAPTAVEVRSTSVALWWPIAFRNDRRQPPTGYLVEMAEGMVSDDYKEVYQSTGLSTGFVMTGLLPSTMYRFRVRAVDYKTGLGSPGPPTVVTTAHPLVNTWRWVSARGISEGRAGGGRRFVEPSTEESNLIPPALQGHSMDPMLGYIFMFGGRSTGYDCEQAITETCRYFDSTNNFLWKLDPLTYRWEQLPAYAAGPEGLPTPRERHVSGVIDQRLLIFGGRADPDVSGNGGPYLNDLWELNPGAERVLNASGSVVDSEGVNLDMVGGGAGVPEGRISFLSATINAETSPPDQECVMDVEVWVEIHHPCLQELRLSLYGPGPAPFSSPGSGFHLGERSPQNMPRGEENILFVGGTGTGTAHPSWVCGSSGRKNISDPVTGTLDGEGAGHVVWFDDQGPEDVSQCCQGPDGSVYNGYMEGRFRPVDSLSRFRGLPADGEWKLSVYDPELNDVRASLRSWGIRVHTGPCHRRYRWTKLNVPGAPEPRYDATSVVFDHYLFVFQGRAEEIFDDMWRFNRHTLEWQRMPIPKDPTPIRDVTAPIDLGIPIYALKPARPLGRVGVLTPWGVLAFGGRNPHVDHISPPVIQRYDPINGTWHEVNPPALDTEDHIHPSVWKDPNFGRPGSDHLETDFAYSAAQARNIPLPTLPHRRLMPSIAFFGETGTRSRRRGVASPKLVIYGGYNDAQPLSDLWEFTIREIIPDTDPAALTQFGQDAGTGVLAGMGSGENTSTNSILGFGTGVHTLGDPAVPGGSYSEVQKANCEFRLISDSSAEQEWQEGCLGSGANVCGVNDILVRAWCTNQFQSIGSF